MSLLRSTALLFALLFTIHLTTAMPVDFADCAAPNGTDKIMHWWQCSSGPVQFLNATPYDGNNKYEYPIHLNAPITMKTIINNPSGTYTKGNLLSTVNIWKYGGWNGCVWSSVPTLGLLKNQDACSNGVPCPIVPGSNKELDVVVDFTQYEQIIQLLKDNQPYQLEYILNDTPSGDTSCLMVQAWAYIK